MKYGVESLSKGAAALAQSLGTGQQMAQEAFERAQLNQNKLAYTGAQARKTDSEAQILADTMAARGDLGSALAALTGQLGLAEGSGDALARAYRASGGKGDALAKMMATIAQSSRLNQAVNESDPTRSNKLLLAGGEKAYTPWAQTAGGLAINEATGAQVQDSAAARATVGKTNAEAGAAHALAGSRNADARATEALEAVRVLMMGTERERAGAAAALAEQRAAGAGANDALASSREQDTARAAAEAALLQQAVDAEDPGRANFLLQAAGQRAYTPYKQTAGGLVIDAGTGGQVQDSPAAQATVGQTLANTALLEQRGSTEQSRAGAYDARAASEAERKRVLAAEADNLARGLSKSGVAPKPVRGAGGKGGTLKAADSNAVYSKAAALFGGLYDPMTGQFQGLDQNKAAKAIAISARAAELLAEDPSNNHSMAVSRAAREYKIDIPEPLDITEDPATDIGTAGALEHKPDTSFGAKLKNFVMGGDAAPADAPEPAPQTPAPSRAGVAGAESGTMEDPVSVMSPQQAEWLPPGTYFRTPAGRLMRVPLRK